MLKWDQKVTHSDDMNMQTMENKRESNSTKKVGTMQSKTSSRG